MLRKPKRKLDGIVAPVLVRPPALVRACNAFVNGLPMILRLAFLGGAVFLAQNFDELTDNLPRSASIIDSAPAPAIVPAVESESDTEDAVLSDRVLHYLNCTYEDYRAAHYDECVEGPSDIYRDTEADPDDIGMVNRDVLIMLAQVEDTDERRFVTY
jgi:hypothetical protein